MKLLVGVLYLVFALVSGNETTESTGSTKSAKPDNIIANGHPAYEGKAPYIVSLVLGTYGSSQTKLCGGAIIANDFVLTAAQCLSTDFVQIHYGSNTRIGQFVHRVESADFYVPSEWPREKGFDIGLIRIPRIHFTYWVNKVNLPYSCNDSFENKWAAACGWGEQANGNLAQSLQCVDLEIMANKSCARFYGPLAPGVMCARTPGGRSTCAGDTGGPLVTYENHTVVGVTSFFSQGGCTAGHPAGFTNVSAHLNWIRSTIGEDTDYYQ